KRILLSILLFILIIGVGIGALFTFYIIKAPDLDPEELTNPFVSEIYDMDGEFVTDRGGSEKRKKIQYDDLPEELIKLLLQQKILDFLSTLVLIFLGYLEQLKQI